MERYTIEEVASKRQKKEFLDLPKRLYKNEKYWVCPLDNDIEARFDPSRNELFNGGEAARWLVRDSTGQVVGRIAAFYNSEQASVEAQPTGGCGFFESVDSQDVANLLFDTARDWLKVRGMEAMDGPINFGDRDQWWGLLVQGFDCTPLYTNPYNFPYYQQLFENYGFGNYFNQHTYLRPLEGGLFGESVYQRVQRLMEIPEYRFESIRKKDIKRHAEEFRTVYNKAWAGFSGVKPMDEEHALKLMNTLKPIIDEDIMFFAYYNDDPIGFFIMVPDLNGVIGDFNGKFGLINKLRMLWRVRRHKAKRIFAIIFGVVPEFHGKGIESGMIYTFEQYIMSRDIGYESLELAWIGDFNPVMMRMVENYVCAHRHKMHTTYRYLFDRDKEFQRCPRVGRPAAPKPSEGEAS